MAHRKLYSLASMIQPCYSMLKNSSCEPKHSMSLYYPAENTDDVECLHSFIPVPSSSSSLGKVAAVIVLWKWGSLMAHPRVVIFIKFIKITSFNTEATIQVSESFRLLDEIIPKGSSFFFILGMNLNKNLHIVGCLLVSGTYLQLTVVIGYKSTFRSLVNFVITEGLYQ